MSSTSNTSKVEALDIVSFDQEYEVFLSFRGPNTRAGFTDHLYRRLIDANVRVFRDDEKLRKGEKIGPRLLQAINRSAIAIVIFSKKYAESKWCLNELVEILKCKRSREMKVIPILYYVKPSEVRNQIGDYKKAFALHEQKYATTIIKEWKEALSEIGSMSGWEIPSDTYSREGELVEDVTKEVSFSLKKAYVKIPDHLVGLGYHVGEILEMLSLETQGVRIIGIHGVGGIGKTTLAKFVYNRLLPKFQGSSFLADARSKDIEDLRTNLRSDILARKSLNYVDKGTIADRFIDKKVLIVVDDVDEKTRIEDLIGKRDKHWFASGSRIILTTRNEGFLRQVPVNKSYELNGMNYIYSLQLFYRHAFESDNPEVDYAILSMQIVETTGGLPLALEVIGSSLRNKSKKEWKSQLEKLKNVPVKDVSSKLRISYNELDERQKHIFLDIACFFIGWDKTSIIHFWDSQRFYLEEAINVLQQKSLIKLQYGSLWMHDQLRDLGREIACEGNIMEPEKQTRLWNREEATQIFMTKRGTERIQGICVEVNEKSFPHFVEEAFAKLSKVRLFWAKREPFRNYSDHPSSATPSNFPYIFSELKWLSWHEFPYMYIETSNFSLVDLTILDLSYSMFTIEWDGWTQIKMAKNLKDLNLTGCKNLVKTPEFSSHPLLERLILEGCSTLVEIDESMGMLEHLAHLNLKGCIKLRKVPKELGCMNSLTELLIDEVNEVQTSQWGNMELEVFFTLCQQLLNCASFNNMTSLRLVNTQITLIPNSIGKLVHLVELHLVNYYSLKKLPESIGGLVSLTHLVICESGIKELPNSIGELVHLVELNLVGCWSLMKLPESIEGLVSLTHLDISKSGIEELPNSIGYLKNLIVLSIRFTPIRELPSTIRMAKKLEKIDAEGCRSLRGGLPMLPESLTVLELPWEIMDAVLVLDLSYLINLEYFFVDVDGWVPRRWAPIESPSPWWIGRLTKLKSLCLAFPSITTLHPNMGSLSLLTHFSLKGCDHLQSIPKLPSDLTSLSFFHCESLETAISDLSYLKKLSSLSISKSSLIKLKGLHSLKSLTYLILDDCMISKVDEFPENLEDLYISNCENLKRLPHMSQCKKLECFTLENCHNLVEIHGRLESLEILSIRCCRSLIKIPDVLNVKTLRRVNIEFCPNLFYESKIDCWGPVLIGKYPKSELEWSFMRNMLRICGFSQNIAIGNEEEKQKGKEKMEWVEEQKRKEKERKGNSFIGSSSYYEEERSSSQRYSSFQAC